MFRNMRVFVINSYFFIINNIGFLLLHNFQALQICGKNLKYLFKIPSIGILFKKTKLIICPKIFSYKSAFSQKL